MSVSRSEFFEEEEWKEKKQKRGIHLHIGPGVYVKGRDALACGSSGRKWRSSKD